MGQQRRKWNAKGDAQRTPKEIFSRIYSQKEWVTVGDEDFSSGAGSANEEVTKPYVETILKWVKNQPEKLKAVDVGCGDFRVGSQLCAEFSSYTGADVVPELIEHLSGKEFGGNTNFVCLDASEEKLPEGDVCFVRQVLQHLSNDRIESLLKNLEKFRYVIITEHVPDEGQLKEKNVDKITGGSIRMTKNSGVYPEDAPFFFRGGKGVKLLEASGGHEGGLIVTTCYSK